MEPSSLYQVVSDDRRCTASNLDSVVYTPRRHNSYTYCTFDIDRVLHGVDIDASLNCTFGVDFAALESTLCVYENIPPVRKLPGRFRISVELKSVVDSW